MTRLLPNALADEAGRSDDVVSCARLEHLHAAVVGLSHANRSQGLREVSSEEQLCTAT